MGQAFAKCLKDKKGISRFAFAEDFSVLDEAMARVVVDISGRPYLDVKLLEGKVHNEIKPVKDNYSFSYFKQFLQAFVSNSQITVHVDVLKGEDFHHILECCFKALGLSLDKATTIDARKKGIPSTKGRL